MLKHAFAAVVILLSFAPIDELGAREEWNRALRQQLQAEQSCELGFITALRELEVNGRTVIEGRAHCVDKRKFDFTREKSGEKFKIKACQPTVC